MSKFLQIQKRIFGGNYENRIAQVTSKSSLIILALTVLVELVILKVSPEPSTILLCAIGTIILFSFSALLIGIAEIIELLQSIKDK